MEVVLRAFPASRPSRPGRSRSCRTSCWYCARPDDALLGALQPLRGAEAEAAARRPSPPTGMRRPARRVAAAARRAVGSAIAGGGVLGRAKGEQGEVAEVLVRRCSGGGCGCGGRGSCCLPAAPARDHVRSRRARSACAALLACAQWAAVSTSVRRDQRAGAERKRRRWLERDREPPACSRSAVPPPTIVAWASEPPGTMEAPEREGRARRAARAPAAVGSGFYTPSKCAVAPAHEVERRAALVGRLEQLGVGQLGAVEAGGVPEFP